MNSVRILILSSLLIFISSGLFAQCFSSTGNPIGGTANMGVMEKNVLKFNTFYKHSYSGRYFLEDELFENSIHQTAEDAVYNYVSMMLAYGLTNKLSLEADGGYYINKTKNFINPIRGYGFSNLVLSAKYNIYYNPVSRFEITTKAGVKLPLRKSEQIIRQGNLIISHHPDVQPSLGSMGFVTQLYLIKEYPFSALRLFALVNYEHNFITPEGFFDLKQYNFGNSLNTSFFVTKHLHMPPALAWLSENWTVILQVRHEHKWQNQLRSQINLGDNPVYEEWETTKNSGSDVFFISPQINYTIASKLNISVMADFPLYQKYNGIQLATNYAFAVNISYDLNFNNH